MLTAQERMFVRDCVNVIVQVFQLYGFDSTGYAVKPTIDHWMLLASHCTPLKLVKYKLAAFYSAWKAQEAPATPFPSQMDNSSILLGGRAYRWFLATSRNQNSEKRFDSFLVSILYAKKGMPRPSKQLLIQAEQDTIRELSKPAISAPGCLMQWADLPEDSPDSIDYTLSRQTVEVQLRRTVTELFSGETFTDEDRMKPFFPSTSANYINTRSMGGAVGCILEDPTILQGLKSDEELIKLEEVGRGRTRRVVANDLLLREKFTELYGRILKRAEAEAPIAVPLALPEALKMRVISKGPPFLYTALKPLQKKMWSVLAKHPAFSLIGGPVTAEYVQERMGAKLPLDDYFLSADYSNATNELHSWVSNVIADQVSTELGLSDVERTLLERSLTHHLLLDEHSIAERTEARAEWILQLRQEFPDLDDSVIENLVKQENGQLMGSVTSFPILCIANAALCRRATELDRNRIFTLKDARICVNGDDALIRITVPGKIFWERLTSFCGLKPSIGKVYISKKFLNINSTTYNYTPLDPVITTVIRRSDNEEVERKILFRKVLYVNLGLLFGLKRSGGKVSIADIGVELGGIGARARDLISSCPEVLREKVLAEFVHRHSELLRSARVPWFLPEILGGLGLPSAGRFCPSDRELRLARVILDSNIKIPSKPVDTPWKVWEYAQRRLKDWPSDLNAVTTMNYEFIGGMTGKGMTSKQSIFGLACIEALFRCKGISDLYDTKSQETGYLRKLQGIWRKVYRTPVYPEPLNLSTLPKSLNFNKENLLTTYDLALETEITTQLGNGDIAWLVSNLTSTQHISRIPEPRAQSLTNFVVRRGALDVSHERE
jgi:hypothetical protein